MGFKLCLQQELLKQNILPESLNITKELSEAITRYTEFVIIKNLHNVVQLCRSETAICQLRLPNFGGFYFHFCLFARLVGRLLPTRYDHRVEIQALEHAIWWRKLQENPLQVYF